MTFGGFMRHHRNDAYTQNLEHIDRGATSNLSDFDYLVRAYPDRLTIIAEGDSWFGYPRKNLLFGPNANILDWLADKMSRRINLLRLESNGDELLEMLSGEQKYRLFELLERYGNSINFLLLSGGGNDLLGQYDLPFLLTPGHYQPGMTAPDCINSRQLDRKLELLRLSLLNLMEIRNVLAPDCHIITHTYDIAIPSNRGLHLLGGVIGKWFDTDAWVKPYLDRKGIPADVQEAIVRIILSRFAEVLLTLKHEPETNGRFNVIQTQGTLRPGHEHDWADEIHPSSDGFEKIADLFINRITQLSS